MIAVLGLWLDSSQVRANEIRTGADEVLARDTLLEGRLVDQAELSGVLNSLYDLRMSLLSVECLEISEASREGSSNREQPVVSGRPPTRADITKRQENL